MRHLFGLIFLLQFSICSSALAGSSNALLQCKSLSASSNRTNMTATIQDIDGDLQTASVKVDGETITFANPDRFAAIFDSKNGVYTINVQGDATERFPNGRFLRFWALPKSFKSGKKTADGKDVWTFRAVLQSTEPRKTKEVLTPRIELQCRLTYGI